MGNMFYYPLEPEAISYHRPQDYNSLGKRKSDIKKDENEIDLLHRTYCADIFSQRKNINQKRKMLTDVSDEDYAKRFPQWEAEDIGDYKVQFEIFDLNRDGLIDFKEMNMVLDEFGESSDEQDRIKYFRQIDLDDSNSVDFEEFLLVLNKLQQAAGLNKAAGNIGNIVTQGAHQVKELRRMSVYKQLTNGLF
uniref:uncharacterized protein LOC104266302 n=1 Tax=Ciona intestinalis TaxID=7719 RepID=UPI00052199AF|nr:uncharacterized protein LOC104266302 [Ciona intestinalis]|eukprot:XP_009860431.1 uncharacterized protein LOC104266302 [Ciona intestinalis]